MSIDFYWEQLFSFRLFFFFLGLLEVCCVISFKARIWSWNVFLIFFFIFCGWVFSLWKGEQKSRAANSVLVMLAAFFSTPCFYIWKAGAQIKLTPEGCAGRIHELAVPQCALFRCEHFWFRSPYKQPQRRAFSETAGWKKRWSTAVLVLWGVSFLSFCHSSKLLQIFLPLEGAGFGLAVFACRSPDARAYFCSLSTACYTVK